MRRVVLAVIVLAGCASASSQGLTSARGETNARGDTLSGLFILQFVNGKELPLQMQDAGSAYTLNHSAIAFRLDGTFAQASAVTAPQVGNTIAPTSFLFDGTFVYAASTQAVSLRSRRGGRIAGALANDVLTLLAGSDTLVFYRQR